MMPIQTKQIIFRTSLFLVLFLAIGLGIMLPTLLKIKKTADESYKLRLLLEQKYEESIRSRVTKQRLNEIKQRTADFGKYIFKAGDELQLITFLENLAATHKLTQTVADSSLNQIGSDQTASISLSLSGSYQDILNYTSDLEASDYFLNIEQIQIKPVFNKNGELSELVNLELTAKLYVNK